MPNRSYIKFLLLLSFGAVLSVLTLMFAAVPMRVARQTYGRALFWGGHLVLAAALIAVGLPAFGITILTLMILLGAYAELEEHSSSVFVASFLSLAITSGVAATATALWSHQTKLDLVAAVKSQVSDFTRQMAAVSPGAQINADALVQQVPSGLLILLMLSLAVGLIWEHRAYFWFRLPRHERGWADLTAFRVPDVFVWITMLAILGAFLQHGYTWLEAVSLNILNVLVVTYFFQGLAIVARFFRTFKVGLFWRGFWYILIVVQLFLLVAFLGFADFWIDFRDRLAKKTAEINKGF